jgi:hypothetical protein
MRFQCRGGRKHIVAPDGSATVPATKPRPDEHAEGPGSAHRWQQMLENGEYRTLAELASAERISSGAVSRRARATVPTASGRA